MLYIFYLVKDQFKSICS